MASLKTLQALTTLQQQLLWQTVMNSNTHAAFHEYKMNFYKRKMTGDRAKVETIKTNSTNEKVTRISF